MGGSDCFHVSTTAQAEESGGKHEITTCVCLWRMCVFESARAREREREQKRKKNGGWTEPVSDQEVEIENEKQRWWEK